MEICIKLIIVTYLRSVSAFRPVHITGPKPNTVKVVLKKHPK